MPLYPRSTNYLAVSAQDCSYLVDCKIEESFLSPFFLLVILQRLIEKKITIATRKRKKRRDLPVKLPPIKSSI